MAAFYERNSMKGRVFIVTQQPPANGHHVSRPSRSGHLHELTVVKN